MLHDSNTVFLSVFPGHLFNIFGKKRGGGGGRVGVGVCLYDRSAYCSSTKLR